MKVIALDFDGVVSDTENECFIISVPAFFRMGEKIKENKRIRNQFRKARAYVKHADCYYTILKILQNPKSDFDNISFQQFSKVREKNREKGKEFHKLFYEERSKLQNNMDNWIKLNPPFKGLPKIINNLMISFPLVIASAKDKNATKLLLESYGIHMHDKNLLTKEFSLDKRDQTKYICKTFGCDFNDIVFVEDNLEQLLNVRDLGVKLILVSWGYNTTGQRREARKLGINVATLKNFEKIVRSI